MTAYTDLFFAQATHAGVYLGKISNLLLTFTGNML